MSRAVFAIPGDQDQRTGGTIYDVAVLRRLNALGHDTACLQLPGSFPEPSTTDMQETFDALSAVPETRPIIVDGLALGALDPARMESVAAPVIGMVHHPLGLESGLASDRARDLLRNEAEVLRHVAHVIVPSEHIAGTVEQEFGIARDRISVAHPGFEPPVEMAKGTVPRADPPLILSVGLLARRKGHDVLLDALSRILDLDWQAEIIGKAHDRDVTSALKAQAEAQGLSDRVRLAGEVDAKTLQDRYARASLFALATRYEGYGMVLGEAMMHGLPVVSCRVGAVPETVGDGGLLVAPDDAGAMAEALRTLLVCQETADGYARAARKRAETLPGWDHTAGIFVDVLERIAP